MNEMTWWTLIQFTDEEFEILEAGDRPRDKNNHK